MATSRRSSTATGTSWGGSEGSRHRRSSSSKGRWGRLPQVLPQRGVWGRWSGGNLKRYMWPTHEQFGGKTPAPDPLSSGTSHRCTGTGFLGRATAWKAVPSLSPTLPSTWWWDGRRGRGRDRRPLGRDPPARPDRPPDLPGHRRTRPGRQHPGQRMDPPGLTGHHPHDPLRVRRDPPRPRQAPHRRTRPSLTHDPDRADLPHWSEAPPGPGPARRRRTRRSAPDDPARRHLRRRRHRTLAHTAGP